MTILATDLLECGMILRSAVCDRSGRLLLPAGSELSDNHLKIFRTWGISGADVENDSDETAVTPAEVADVNDPLVLAEAQRIIAALFIHNDPLHPMIQELMKICVARQVIRGI